ncbi:MAG: glutathione S-transferase family protein [Pseudomonadota bacterium]
MMRKLLGLLLLPVLIALLPLLLLLLVYRGKTYHRASGRQPYTVPHTAPLELHFTPVSLCSSKVALCLEESGLEYRRVELDIGHFGRFDQLTDAFLKMNPNACVPVLVHDGHPVLESHDIIEYVCSELGADHLLPAAGDSAGLKAMEHWTERGSFVDMSSGPEKHLGAAVALLSAPLFGIDKAYMHLGTLLKALPRHPQPKIIVLKIINWFLGPKLPPASLMEPAVEGLQRGMQEMAAQLSDGRSWLAGERFTLADITWAANFARLGRVGALDYFLAPHAELQAYWQRLSERPAYDAVFRQPLRHGEEMRRLAAIASAAKNRSREVGVREAYGL